VVPDLSSASTRVSDIVNTAMLSGMKGLAVSVEDIWSNPTAFPNPHGEEREARLEP
jgi:hypothetical protein